MNQTDKKQRTCEELLLEYKNIESFKKAERLIFHLNDSNDRDVYNICAPFLMNQEIWIAGRVEDRSNEESKIIFFKKVDDEFYQGEYPELDLQDPFVTRINQELVVGGVEVFQTMLGETTYRTIFYKGNDLNSLERFAEGPERMKDIRLLELPDKEILVVTRPQGEIGGRGKIGYLVIKQLRELCADKILQAVILEDQFSIDEWGGANELHLLDDGWVGVLSHIARFDEEGDRHYYSSAFCLQIETGDYTPMKMIAQRADFLPGATKRTDLQDVIFSGGLVRQGSGLATLYCGVSDCEAQMIQITDPFLNHATV